MKVILHIPSYMQDITGQIHVAEIEKGLGKRYKSVAMDIQKYTSSTIWNHGFSSGR